MPKRIDLTYDKLLETVEMLIEDKRYDEITARDIANIVSCSVGKIYSFGKSKNEIVAEVIFKDWKRIIKEIDIQTDIRSGLQNVYNAVYLFTIKYIELFKVSTENAVAYQAYINRHDEIVADIEDRIAALSVYNEIEVLHRRNNFIGENILFYATKLRPYGDIEKILVWILTYNTGDLKAYGTFS